MNRLIFKIVNETEIAHLGVTGLTLFSTLSISVMNIKSESLMTSGAAQSKFSRKAS